jgi:hypothetical protein
MLYENTPTVLKKTLAMHIHMQKRIISKLNTQENQTFTDKSHLYISLSAHAHIKSNM